MILTSSLCISIWRRIMAARTRTPAPLIRTTTSTLPQMPYLAPSLVSLVSFIAPSFRHRVRHASSTRLTPSIRRITRTTCGAYSRSTSISAPTATPGANLVAEIGAACPKPARSSRPKAPLVLAHSLQMAACFRHPSHLVYPHQRPPLALSIATWIATEASWVARLGAVWWSGGAESIAQVECVFVSLGKVWIFFVYARA